MNTLSTEAYSHISVNPLGKCFGAEIAGVDLSQPLPQTVFDEIEAAFATWSVVVFRNQVLTPDQQLVFARRFGALEVNAFDRYGLEGHPGVLKVSNIHEEGVPQGYADAGSFWHTDMSYTATPPRLTMLYALEIPHDDTGQPLGDTLFASAVAAYDGLDEETQQRIRGLRAVHDFSAKRRGVKKAVVISAAQIAANPPGGSPDRPHPSDSPDVKRSTSPRMSAPLLKAWTAMRRVHFSQPWPITLFARNSSITTDGKCAICSCGTTARYNTWSNEIMSGPIIGE